MSGPPLPETDWDLTRAFWQAAREERFLLPRCASCRRWVWYPEPQCPHCGGDAVPWTAASGRGTLFTWTVVERALYKAYADQAPYVTGLVAMQEDPRVRFVTRIVNCGPEDLEMEMPMRAVFRPLELGGVEGSVVAPFFEPDTG